MTFPSVHSARCHLLPLHLTRPSRDAARMLTPLGKLSQTPTELLAPCPGFPQHFAPTAAPAPAVP